MKRESEKERVGEERSGECIKVLGTKGVHIQVQIPTQRPRVNITIDNTHIKICHASAACTTTDYVTIACPTTKFHKCYGSRVHRPVTLLPAN